MKHFWFIVLTRSVSYQHFTNIKSLWIFRNEKPFSYDNVGGKKRKKSCLYAVSMCDGHISTKDLISNQCTVENVTIILASCKVAWFSQLSLGEITKPDLRQSQHYYFLLSSIKDILSLETTTTLPSSVWLKTIPAFDSEHLLIISSNCICRFA